MAGDPAQARDPGHVNNRARGPRNTASEASFSAPNPARRERGTLDPKLLSCQHAGFDVVDLKRVDGAGVTEGLLTS